MLSRGAGSVPRVMVLSMLVRNEIWAMHVLSIWRSTIRWALRDTISRLANQLTRFPWSTRKLPLIPTFSVVSFFFRASPLQKRGKNSSVIGGGGVRFIYVCIRKRVTVKTQNTINRMNLYEKEHWLFRKKKVAEIQRFWLHSSFSFFLWKRSIFYFIPKPGKIRQITQPYKEDIIIMDALSLLLNVIFENLFFTYSHGFRKEKGH